MAAQLARDRKREKMTDLEIALEEMKEQNDRLAAENEKLRKRTNQLSSENSSLRKCLGMGGVSDVDVKSEPVSTESAAFSLCSQQKSRAPGPIPTMTSATCLSLLLTLRWVAFFVLQEKYIIPLKKIFL